MTHLAWQSFSVYAQALLPTKYEAQWEKGFILRRGRDIFFLVWKWERGWAWSVRRWDWGTLRKKKGTIGIVWRGEEENVWCCRIYHAFSLPDCSCQKHHKGADSGRRRSRVREKVRDIQGFYCNLSYYVLNT